MADFRFKFAFFCDEVRQEDNGKSLIIGAMTSGAVAAKSFPMTKRFLSVFVVAETSLNVFNLRYRVLMKGSKEVIRSGSARFEADGDESPELIPIDFGIDLHGLELKSPGEYQLQMSLEQQRWKTLTSLKVLQVD